MKRRFFSLFLTLCILFSCSSIGAFEAETTWKEETTVPLLHTNYGVAAVDTKIYLIGGYINNSKDIGNVEIYDTVTKVWSTGTPMLRAKKKMQLAVVGDKIYALSGEVGNDGAGKDVQIYDTKTDTWTSGKPMPTGRFDFGCEVIDNKIYVFGGYGYDEFNENDHYSIPLTVDVFDTTTNDWSSAKSLSKPAVGCSSAVVNGKIYVFGGKDAAFVGDNYNLVRIYNPVTNTWTSGKSMPSAKGSCPAVAIDGKVYIMGGHQYPSGLWFSSVDVYDANSNTWSKGPELPTYRVSAKAAQVNGKIYLIGGYYSSSTLEYTTTINSIQIGEPVIPEPPQEPETRSLAVTINAGEQVQLSVSSYLEDNATVLWQSSNEEIATVDNNGLVSGVSKGTCDITAHDGTKFSQTISIRVMNDKELIYEKVNDNDSKITYNGAWTAYKDDSAFYNGDEHFSNQKNAYAEFSFVGCGIELIAATSSNLGKCDIYVDEILVKKDLDLYSPSLEAQKIIFSKPDLTEGSHTIRIVVTGEKNNNSSDSYVTIDAFQVIKNSN